MCDQHFPAVQQHHQEIFNNYQAGFLCWSLGLVILTTWQKTAKRVHVKTHLIHSHLCNELSAVICKIFFFFLVKVVNIYFVRTTQNSLSKKNTPHFSGSVINHRLLLNDDNITAQPAPQPKARSIKVTVG